MFLFPHKDFFFYIIIIIPVRQIIPIVKKFHWYCKILFGIGKLYKMYTVSYITKNCKETIEQIKKKYFWWCLYFSL